VEGRDGYMGLIEADVCEQAALGEAFDRAPDLCLHLAASINVQDSIDDPSETFRNDVEGTFRVLEAARARRTPVLFMSTCMVYAAGDEPIDEAHPTRPASPYAACKLAGEALTLSYWHAYGLPTCVVRPFNTYGPYQRTDGEGGVVAIFARRALAGLPLEVFGSGVQTRDLLYVEDCADFVVRAALSGRAWGSIVNAGTGRDIPINDLAHLIAGGDGSVRHVPHIHPQSEIYRLRCDSRLAGDLFGWRAAVSLEEGVERTKAWIAST
jgi:nucleoside-diphosphate-sugar epimerase